MTKLFNEEVCSHVQQTIGTVYELEDWDKSWWIPNSTRKFSVGCAWELMGESREPQELMMNIWEKGIPFKVSFLLWRLWKLRIPMGKSW
uniref:Putative ovule protein n=1 Tax=Solanum chacoense TaxID=4108 RepID=A0A0V0H027_SOLCH